MLSENVRAPARHRPSHARLIASAAALGGTIAAGALLTGCDTLQAGLQTAPVAARPTATSCKALATAPPAGVKVLRTDWIAADTVRPDLGGRSQATAKPLPEHCLIRGEIDARVGTDGTRYATGFELRLPSAWNGRFLYQGGGGNDGVIREAIGANTGATGRQDNALLRGFAVVSTDAGHQGTLAQGFGADPQARLDHAFAAHDKTARTAKTLLTTFYGKPAEHSYFVGCSGGGRQGMMFSQRFPEYFDGIVAVAPAMNVSRGATIAAAWTTQKFLAVAPIDNHAQKILSRALDDPDLKLLAGGIRNACDASDGLRDGIVANVGACRFDPSTLQCPGAKTSSCLSAGQVAAVASVFAGPVNRAGQPLYFSRPWDPGIEGAGWRAWTLGDATGPTPNSRDVTLMSDALSFEFVTPGDALLSVFTFDFDADPARMDSFNDIFTTAEDVQLTGFKAHGGKLLFFHGGADPIFSSNDTVDYMRRLDTAQGGADEAGRFARLFLVPGMNHCEGGPATDSFDGLSAIVDWVEHAKAPDIVVAHGTASMPGVNRPLCRYPAYARYKGAGSTSEAASFECRADP